MSFAPKSAEALAFVTSLSRTPLATPVAALKSLGRRQSKQSSIVDHGPTIIFSAAGSIPSEESTDNGSNNIFEFGIDDDAVRAMRSQMVDIVYQRSLERLNSLDN